jgi:hypothetical protein
LVTEEPRIDASKIDPNTLSFPVCGLEEGKLLLALPLAANSALFNPLPGELWECRMQSVH